MLITLKQAEIEQALKQFIASRGIAVAGKAITIEFTSGRKNNGLSAEVDVEDSEQTAVVVAAVDSSPLVAVAEPVAVVAAVQPEEAAEPAEAEASEPVAAAPAVSLFG